ncbi:DUF4238 domain-containing protein [Emticicia oligotrophica]|nr:DUF4238 domain-containing protein [Emticicia oligotrophica]
MTNNPRNHHLVPQKGYLEKFTNRNKQIFKCKLDTKLPQKFKGFATAAICYDKDYYKFDNVSLLNPYNIQDPFYIEKNVFQKYENRIGIVIDKIAKKQSFLTKDDCEKLIFGLVDIKFRNPFFRKSDYVKTIDNVVDEMINDVFFIEHISKEFNLPIELAIEATYLSKENLKNNTSKDLHNLFLLNRHLEEKSIHNYINFLLINLDWQILYSPINNQFITSDNPGFCLESGMLFNTKFKGNFTFIFPLTSRLALQISANKHSHSKNDLKILNYLNIPYELVHFINLQTAAVANNEIYGANENVLRTVWNSTQQYKSTPK